MSNPSGRSRDAIVTVALWNNIHYKQTLMSRPKWQ